jgi:hypothetical protein
MKMIEIDQRVRDKEYIVMDDGAFAARYICNDMTTGKEVFTRKYHGETALQCATRDFMDDVTRAVHE